MAAWTLKVGWFLINYDVILDNNMVCTMFWKYTPLYEKP